MNVYNIYIYMYIYIYIAFPIHIYIYIYIYVYTNTCNLIWDGSMAMTGFPSQKWQPSPGLAIFPELAFFPEEAPQLNVPHESCV